MIPLCLPLIFFFLFWMFFLGSFSLAANRLGELFTKEMTEENKGRFFYLPLHQFLFKERRFDLLLFSCSLSGTLVKLCYAAVTFLCFFSLPTLTIVSATIYTCSFLVLAFLFSGFFPKLWVLRSPQHALIFSAPISNFFLYLSLPFSIVFLKVLEWSVRGEGEEAFTDPLEETKETILSILRSANMSEKLNSGDIKLLESVISFKERIVREVMVPRVQLFSLAVETSIRNAATLLVEEGYSRIPVFRETIDDIVGVLMFKDILEFYMDCDQGKKDPKILDQSIEPLVKPVFYTPETKKASQLLQEFRSKQMHMAIVVDEYGGTEGVVTIEDLLEEIVGDISDEYDVEEETLYTSQPGTDSWIVDARMSILDAEETFDIHIPEEGDYDTIGGYIFHKVGSIPAKGLKIHHEDFDLEILSSTERSIGKVRITPRRENEDKESQ